MAEPLLDECILPSKTEQWESLPHIINRRMHSLLSIYNKTTYEPGVDNLIPAGSFIDCLYWLLPLAYRMQAEFLFRPFYVESHHAVIDIMLEARDQSKGRETLTIIASSENIFDISVRQGYSRKTGDSTEYRCYGVNSAIAVLKVLCNQLPRYE